MAAFAASLACTLAALGQSIPRYDPLMAWPLCGRITDNPPPGWALADGCPIDRHGSAAFADLPVHSTFGPRPLASASDRYDFHRGIDLSAPIGTPLFAVADGEVRKAGPSSGFSDPVIQLRHYRPGESTCSNQGCYTSNYLHVNSWNVSIGDNVARGQYIGTSGESASGYDHLHFEIRDAPANDPFSAWQRDCVHPLGVLPFNDTAPVELTITAMSTVGNLSNVTVELKTTRPDVLRVGVTVLDAPGGSAVAQPGDTPDARGYNVLPSFFDFDAWNVQYTHKDSSTVPFSTFESGGALECPYAHEHGGAYDAAVHMDQQDPDSALEGLFNGVRVVPPEYSTGVWLLQLTFLSLLCPTDSAGACCARPTASGAKGAWDLQGDDLCPAAAALPPTAPSPPPSPPPGQGGDDDGDARRRRFCTSGPWWRWIKRSRCRTLLLDQALDLLCDLGLGYGPSGCGARRRRLAPAVARRWQGASHAHLAASFASIGALLALTAALTLVIALAAILVSRRQQQRRGAGRGDTEWHAGTSGQ